MPRTAALALALLLAGRAAAQHPSDVVYVDTAVARVDIALDPDSLAWVLAHPTSDHEVPARFTFTRGALVETVASVGFRLRGNTSRFSRKHSFKVSFNTFVRGQDWRGVEKLNLNGEHNDPSLARTATTWGVFREAGVVAPRVGYAELYVNGALYGLYANVEHLDETYLERRFGRDDGDLFKCLYPADLADRGASGADYRHSADGRPVYEFSQGADADAAFDRLAGFITTLNRTPAASLPAALEAVFDVNSALRAFAADVATGNWDDYWYNQNNFYLHFDPSTERFVYLPYDADNTLGVDFLGVDWGRRAPYTWGHPTQPRPLATRLLAVPEYRARFTFYLRRLLAGPFTTGRLFPRLDALEAVLTEAAARDPYRGLDYGYTLNDFHRSFREATGAHVKYGLKPFVETRRATLLPALDATDVPPIVDLPVPARRAIRPAEPLTVTVRIEDEAPLHAATLAARLGTTTTETPLRDDGLGADAAANDGVYTAVVPAPGAAGTLRLTATATDAAGQTRTSRPFGVAVAAPTPDVVVNEFMASNTGVVRDPAGDAEDWVELHNPTGAPVRLAGMTLTDNLARPDKWALPDTTIPAGGFVVVWADEEPAEGAMHAAFKLSASGEALGLYRGGVPVDTLRFGAQASDVARGRAPDGTGAFAALAAPTPGAPNAAPVDIGPEAAPGVGGFRAYPNPSDGPVTLAFGGPSGADAAVVVFDVLGRQVRQFTVAAGATGVVWDGADDGGRPVAPGLYIVRAPDGAARPVVRR